MFRTAPIGWGTLCATDFFFFFFPSLSLSTTFSVRGCRGHLIMMKLEPPPPNPDPCCPPQRSRVSCASKYSSIRATALREGHSYTTTALMGRGGGGAGGGSTARSGGLAGWCAVLCCLLCCSASPASVHCKKEKVNIGGNSLSQMTLVNITSL